eukprot:ctg_321.g86
MEEEEEDAVVVSLSDAVMREAISALIALEKKRYAQQCKSRKRSITSRTSASRYDLADHLPYPIPGSAQLETTGDPVAAPATPPAAGRRPQTLHRRRCVPVGARSDHSVSRLFPRASAAGISRPNTPLAHRQRVVGARPARPLQHLRAATAVGERVRLVYGRPPHRAPVAVAVGAGVFRRKKQPVPLSLEAVDGYTLPRSAPGSNVGAARSSSWERLLQQCERVRDGTTLTISGEGDCCAVRVGTTDMNIDALADNIRAVIHALQPLVPGGLRTGIASLHLKSNHSTALPLYWNSMATAVVAVARGEKEAIPQAHPPPRDGIVWVKRGCITPMMEKRQQHLRARRQRRQALRRR